MHADKNYKIFSKTIILNDNLTFKIKQQTRHQLGRYPSPTSAKLWCPPPTVSRRDIFSGSHLPYLIILLGPKCSAPPFLERKPIRERSPHLPSRAPIAFHLVEWTGVSHDYLRAANPQAHTHTHTLHGVLPLSWPFTSVSKCSPACVCLPCLSLGLFKISQTAQKWSPTIKIYTGYSGVQLKPDSSNQHLIFSPAS